MYFSKIYYAELRLEKLDYKTETNLIDLIKIYLERNKLFFLKSSPPKLCPDNLPLDLLEFLLQVMETVYLMLFLINII